MTLYSLSPCAPLGTPLAPPLRTGAAAPRRSGAAAPLRSAMVRESCRRGWFAHLLGAPFSDASVWEHPSGKHWGQTGAKLLNSWQTQSRRGVRNEPRKPLLGVSEGACERRGRALCWRRRLSEQGCQLRRRPCLILLGVRRHSPERSRCSPKRLQEKEL